MKKVWKISSYGLLFMMILFLLDLYIFRGFYSSKTPINYKNNEVYLNHNFEFLISKKNDSIYNFKFSNKAFPPKLIVSYRYDWIQNLSDSLFFSNYMFDNIYPNINKQDYDFHFSCGTGVVPSSINPFEKFNTEFSYREIVERCYYQIMNTYNCDILDIVKNRKLNYSKFDSLVFTEKFRFKEKDSVKLEFYFPLFGLYTSERSYISSNKISIASNDLLTAYIKKRKSIID